MQSIVSICLLKSYKIVKFYNMNNKFLLENIVSTTWVNNDFTEILNFVNIRLNKYSLVP